MQCTDGLCTCYPHVDEYSLGLHARCARGSDVQASAKRHKMENTQCFDNSAFSSGGNYLHHLLHATSSQVNTV